MADITIIGGGFSASIAKLVISEPCQIITPKSFTNVTMSRRKSLEINKIFSAGSKSFGTLKFNLINVNLHDRLSFGGNSKIWGGFINLNNIPIAFIDMLKSFGIVIKPLSFSGTGSISNRLGIAQLQDLSGNTYDSSFFLDCSVDGYLDSFLIEGHRIRLNLNCMGVKKTIFTDKLVLCLGTVQLLDLLYRSGFLSNVNTVELTEFSYKLKSKITFFPNQFSENCTVIRFELLRAFCHFLGIQKKVNFFNFFKIFPIYIEQHFSKTVKKCVLQLNEDIFSNNPTKQDYSSFGDSIHYCNLRIDGEGINDFISRLNPNIIGLGMPFVNQAEPGPISNDIIIDALTKLKN